MNLSSKTKVLNFLRKVFQNPVLEKHLVKRTRGKSTKYILSKLVPNNYQYASNSKRIISRNGINMEVDISDYVGHYIYYGFLDKGLNTLFTLCKKGDTVIDVGTNIGYVLLKFAQAVGQGGKVYGFEPDPYNYSKCLHNLSLNNFTNIHLEKCGLGHTRGNFNLSVDTITNRGGNRITLNESTKESVQVEVIKLDDFIAAHQIVKVDLIKIDVEGFELNVLKGAEHFLREHQPTLFIELDDNNLKQQGQSARELIEFIVNINYQVTHAEAGSIITPNDDFKDIHIDIICKPATLT